MREIVIGVKIIIARSIPRQVPNNIQNTLISNSQLELIINNAPQLSPRVEVLNNVIDEMDIKKIQRM